MAKTFTVGVAGSTSHTRLCAEALRMSGNFEIVWVLTPPPQPLGRKHELTKNPLHLWAEEHSFPVVFVEGKIRSELQPQLQPQPDFLLVVDFGYLVPSWLLAWPRIAPLNIHPSLLPRWRGSSPGQFVLLHGEKRSAVTIMVMGEGLDTGPLLWQGEFSVDPMWSQTSYYKHSFEFAAKELPAVMEQVASGSLKPQPQLEASPTAIAKRFKKDDGFIAWETIAQAANIAFQKSQDISELTGQHTSQLIQEVHENTQQSWHQVINNAVHALSPWPGIWTYLPTTKGLKRMKVLETRTQNDQLVLEIVQIEGELMIHWDDVKPRLSPF